MSSEDLRTIENKISINNNVYFTDDEVQILKSIIQLQRGFMAAGNLAKGLERVFKFIGYMIAIWLAIKYGAIDFIKATVK